MTDKMPEDTGETWIFREKFGKWGFEVSTGEFVYGTCNEQYTIPADATKEYLTELIRKSLADGHDYLLDYAKERGREIVYEPGCVY